MTANIILINNQTPAKRGVIKAFREYLNDYHKDERRWKNFRFQQRIRGYGDYLYAQDRAKFHVTLQEVLFGKFKAVYDFDYTLWLVPDHDDDAL